MKKMEEKTIVLYSIEEHLNSNLLLAIFIAENHPSISIIILSTAPNSATTSITGKPSITYRQLPSIPLPPTPTPSTNIVELFFETPRLQNPTLQKTLEEISTKTKINAFIIDYFCYTSLEVSTSLNIPTYFFVSSGAFSLCAMMYFPMIEERIHEDIGNFNDYIEVPGCPPIHSLDFPKGQFFRKSNTYKHFMCAFKEVINSTGVLVHSFDALEFRAKEALTNGLCNPEGKTPPVYFVGPLGTEITKNGGSENECLKWLDTQPERSVIFLCFGRRGLFSGEQLREIAIGLEKSGHRFLWSVRSPPGDPDSDPDLDKLLPEGFVERTKERGFVIKKWAPQKEVLSHESVGGFVTHCGWSSVLESVSYGVPMIGFPMYAEQRMNKVFMVEEMKIALPLEEEYEGFVKAAELEKRVRELMESKTTGKAIKARVTELKISAKSALGKGGSSVVALEKFVRSLCHEI